MNTEPFRVETDLIPPGSRVLCAVSGGADSMCLLQILYSRREELNIEVMAAHFEHGIRGSESVRDAQFVAGYCRENGIVCRVGSEDIPARAAENGLGLEECARIFRYEFLKAAANELGCDLIATAHNADDNAETMIFNLSRGTGGAGLRGIPTKNGNVVRPLLGMTRKEIEDYMASHGVPFIMDSTNFSDEYSRNKIRHNIMPVMRELNPSFSRGALKTAELLRRDEEYFLELADEFIKDFYTDGGIPLEQFRKLKAPVAARVIRRLCPKGLSMEQTDRVLRFAAQREKFITDLHGIRVRAERGVLYFGEEEQSEPGTFALCDGCTVELPASGMKIKCEPGIYSEEVYSKFKTYQLKYANIYGTLSVGPRKPGDRMRPVGRNCTKSLKALFLEKKMTSVQKKRCPVIRDEKGILLVPGVAADERTAAGPGDKVMKITIIDN